MAGMHSVAQFHLTTQPINGSCVYASSGCESTRQLARGISRHQADVANACDTRSYALPSQQLDPCWESHRVGVPEAALDVSLLGDEGHRREAVAGLRAHANQDEGPSSGQRLHASLRNTAGLVPRMRLCELGPAVDRGYTHTVEDPNDSAGWHLP